MVLALKTWGAVLAGGSPPGGTVKIEVTYKGVFVRTVNGVVDARAGDVLEVPTNDGMVLIGMGRAKLYEPKEAPPEAKVTEPDPPKAARHNRTKKKEDA